MKYFRRAIYLVVFICFVPASAGSYDEFFRAVAIDNVGAVSDLLARGFDPNSPDEKGQRPLFLALREGSVKVAAALLAHPDIRIDASNGSDETPLMIAALRGNLDAVRRLLERGAQINRPGWSALHYAATGPDPGTTALLLERGAQVDAASPNRSTPLMMAARYGSEAAVELLLAKGAQPRLRNDRGLSAADFARLAGRDELAARLEAAAR